MANKGLAGGGFRKCGNDWSYGRFLGSVARKGVSGALEEGRGLGAGDERDCGAKERNCPRATNSLYYIGTVCQEENKSFVCWGIAKGQEKVSDPSSKSGWVPEFGLRIVDPATRPSVSSFGTHRTQIPALRILRIPP